MRSRVIAVDAAAEDGNGQAARLERSAMGFAVDAAREAAHDDQTGGSELATEATRNLCAVGRARTCTDNGDGRAREDFIVGAAADVEPLGWVIDRA
jgi:hypothetical protein